MAEIYRPRDWSSHPPFIHAGYKSRVMRGPTKSLVPIGREACTSSCARLGPPAAPEMASEQQDECRKPEEIPKIGRRPEQEHAERGQKRALGPG